MSLVVVGVDGSEHGDAALAFAAEEAVLRDADLRIVCAWQIPANMTMDMGMVSGVFESFRDEAELMAAQAVETANQLRPAAKAHAKVVEGHPATVLLEESQGATLLVVGSRGRGELAGILLGSVSQHVIHHSSCPVTVVPKPQEPKGS
jgi:nucleotide-binding universal stress UspA family protein